MIEDSNNDDVIDQMLKRHEQEEWEDSDDSTTSQSQSFTEPVEVDEPEQGHVGDGGALAGKDYSIERRCRNYAKKFVAEGYEGTYLPVDLSEVEWYAALKMTRTSGRACYYKGSRTHRVKISKHLVENADWERVCKTIRHELVHIWQKQNKQTTGHGLSFKKWCPKLDIQVRADNPAQQEYKYEIHCPNCGFLGGKMKKCKSVREIVNKGRRYCTNCGKQTKGDLFVMKDGQKVLRI